MIPCCPHCGHKLPTLAPRFVRGPEIRRVLKLAAKPTHIEALVTEYRGNSMLILHRSARRAIERLVKSGHLKRVSAGRYVAR